MSEKIDLIVRKSRLIGKKDLVDIGIKDDKIVRVDKKIESTSKQELDVKGRLTSPGFIDAHMHLDHAFSGGEKIWAGRKLGNAVKINDELRKKMTPKQMKKIARMAAELALKNGTTAIRTHTSVDQITGVKQVEILLDLKKELSNLVDMQVVAFMTELPLTKSKIGESLLRQAMNLGADLVGGLPYRDPNPEKYLDIIFNVAKDFDADIDLHVDETNNPNVLTLETLAEKTFEYGYKGRVTAGHCCSLSAVGENVARRVIRKVKDAKMSIVANPLTNLYLKGDNGKPNGITRVKELLDAGVNVIFATDNTKDMMNPLGTADMLVAGLFLAYWEDFGGVDPSKTIFDMGTYKAAGATNIISNYGIEEGGRADLVVFDAKSPGEAIVEQAKRLYVIKNGRILVDGGVLKL